jgi:hypothetical protein
MPAFQTTWWPAACSISCCYMLSTHGRTVRALAISLYHDAYLNIFDLHAAGGLYKGRLLDEAIRRYMCVWLPFLNSTHPSDGSKVTHVPPLDIAYVWHVHRLNPRYVEHCKQRYGQVFIPAEPFAFTTIAPAGWDRLQPFRDLSSPRPLQESFYPPKPAVRTINAGFLPDAVRFLPDAVRRQAAFSHMFLRLCYQDRSYLELVSDQSECTAGPELVEPAVSMPVVHT